MPDPGLYPAWMVIEQIAFSAVLLVIFWTLTRAPVMTAYRRPRWNPPVEGRFSPVRSCACAKAGPAGWLG